MDYGKPEVEWRAVSPVEAKEILETSAYDRNRTIAPRHVNFLSQCVENDEFNGYDPIMMAQLGKRRIILNGHHRLTMVAELDRPVRLLFVTVRVGSEQDIELLYSTFDRQRTRSHVDIIESYGTSEKFGLNRKQVGLISSASLMVHYGFGARSGEDYDARSPTFRNDLMLIYGAAGKQFFNDIAGAPRVNVALFLRQEVIAVALATYMHQPAKSKATEFWKGLYNDDGLVKGDPRKALIQRYRSPYDSPGKMPIGWNARATALAWNAFFEGKELTIVKVPNISAEIRIAGTIYTGRERVRMPTAKVRTEAHRALTR